MAVTGELHLCVNKLVYAPQPGRGCALHPSPPVCVSVAGCCCCCCVALSKERFWKMAHGGRKRARAALCRSACPNMLEVWQEADTLIKSYLEPLLIVPSGVSSLTSYHTHPRVGHALDYLCVHALPYEPLKITQRCILFIIVVIMSSSCVTRYSIDRSSDPDKYFYIEITSGSLMTVRSLDREEVGWHNITILAMEMSTSYTHANKDTSGYN